LLAATERGKQQEVGTGLIAAICKRPDATPASIFPRAARSLELNLICDLHFIDLLDSNSREYFRKTV